VQILSDCLQYSRFHSITYLYSGVHPVPGTWRQWKLKRLKAKPLRRADKDSSKAAEQMMQSALMNNNGEDRGGNLRRGGGGERGKIGYR
jgi:hypothetical protein